MKADAPVKAAEDTRTVCDGCWLVGICARPVNCRCPCDGGRAWRHADDPNRRPA